MESIISAKNLRKTFKDQRVLSDVTFNIKKGSVVGILGSNGAGKTTLLRTLVGFYNRDGGEAKIFNDSSPNLSAQTKHKIGFVAQESELLSWMKVKQIIKYTKSFYNVWDDALVSNLLKEWDIDSNKVIQKLSVGQQQKLSIILALAHKPEILILDEPVASLDPLSRRKFIKTLIDKNLDEETTILFSTHITSDLERVAAELLILKDGSVKFQGDVDELKETVAKLNIRASGSLPDDLMLPGQISMSKSGNVAQIVTEELKGIDINDLKQKLNADISIEKLSLEDIFVELHS
ncbi:MAG: ABC transporter ATP-binding protein [Gammaproteobacteria bacterium]|nr:ABC transporter ATP-binding protein [Gammaproteobacteria bacterium]